MSPIKSNPTFEALANAAEDISRFSPWEMDLAPFMMCQDEDGEGVVVVFEEGESKERAVRFILGASGIKSFCLEGEMDPDEPSGEAIVAAYEGHYYEIGYNMKAMTSFEKAMSGERKDALRFHYQRQGASPVTITDTEDYDKLTHLVKDLLRLFSRQLLNSHDTHSVFSINSQSQGNMLTLARYLVSDECARTSDYTLLYKDFIAPGAPLADEFTDARVAHLRPTADEYELFYLYVPTRFAGSSVLSQVVFLVNLESGFIEYNDAMPLGPKWQEKLLRGIYGYFLEEKKRPQTLYLSSQPCYHALATSLMRAKIHPVYLQESFVAEEILDTYLEAMHLDRYDLLKDTLVRR